MPWPLGDRRVAQGEGVEPSSPISKTGVLTVGQNPDRGALVENRTRASPVPGAAARQRLRGQDGGAGGSRTLIPRVRTEYTPVVLQPRGGVGGNRTRVCALPARRRPVGPRPQNRSSRYSSRPSAFTASYVDALCRMDRRCPAYDSGCRRPRRGSNSPNAVDSRASSPEDSGTNTRPVFGGGPTSCARRHTALAPR